MQNMRKRRPQEQPRPRLYAPEPLRPRPEMGDKPEPKSEESTSRGVAVVDFYL